MRSHRQVAVDVDAKVASTSRLDRSDGAAVDQQRRRWQLMLSSDGRTPQELWLVWIRLKPLFDRIQDVAASTQSVMFAVSVVAAVGRQNPYTCVSSAYMCGDNP